MIFSFPRYDLEFIETEFDNLQSILLLQAAFVLRISFSNARNDPVLNLSAQEGH